MIPMLSDPGATKGFPEGLKGKPRLEPGVRRDGASARLWEIATLMLGEGGAGVGGYSPPPELLVRRGPVPQEQAMGSWLFLPKARRLTEHLSWGMSLPHAPSSAEGQQSPGLPETPQCQPPWQGDSTSLPWCPPWRMGSNICDTQLS